MEIEQNIWAFTPEGEVVILYTMRNSAGAEVKLTNIGASVVSITVPDRNGVMGDVALGYGDWRSYLNDGPYMGKTVGRYANRIGNARFTLDGQQCRITQNIPPHTLHGGVDNFSSRLWASRVETDRVVFSLLSPDGDQGYPGELGVEVVYDWDDDCNLEVTFFARTDRPTVINLTNHSYFNLAGHDSGSVMGHLLTLNSSHYLPITPTGQIPTGELAPVEGTPMDFRTPKALGRDVEADFEPLVTGHGYDHCWMVGGWSAEGELDDRLRDVALLADPASGRSMMVRSTQPAVQIYAGNWLAGSPASKSGREYDNRDGVAIECQGAPDAPNKDMFPSQRLDPGETYNEKIVFSFFTES